MADSLFALCAALSAKPVGSAVMLTVIAFTVMVRRNHFSRVTGEGGVIRLHLPRLRVPLVGYFRHAA